MGGVRRVRPRHHDEPNPGAQPSLLRPHDVAQPPSNPISHNGGANMLRRNEPRPKGFLLLYVRSTEDQIATTLGGPLPFYARELGRHRQPFRFWKGQFFPAHDPDRAPDPSGKIRI